MEQNFPLHMLAPLGATATAKELQDRIAIEIRNDRNDRLRLMYLMQDRTTVFTCIYECARKHHKQFATDLITWCDLSASGFPNARDGPRAWLLLLRELAGKASAPSPPLAAARASSTSSERATSSG